MRRHSQPSRKRLRWWPARPPAARAVKTHSSLGCRCRTGVRLGARASTAHIAPQRASCKPLPQAACKKEKGGGAPMRDRHA